MTLRVKGLVIALILLAVQTPVFAQTTAPEPDAVPSVSTEASPAPSDSTLVLPGGTPVKIGLLAEMQSNTVHTGDRFRFKALEDVDVNGWVAIAKDALGEGEVTAANAAGGNGHPGKIALQFDWIYSADGLKIKLSDVPTDSNGEAQKGGASTATIASYLLLGPLGLFAHNFVHGKEVVIKTDQKIPVYVFQTVHVVAKTKVTSADGFAH